jgi:putative membrane protein
VDATVETRERAFLLFNALLSTAALAFLGWLLFIHEGGGAHSDLSFLPAVNAGLNTITALLLTAGWIAIRRGDRRLHRYLMVSAFAASGLFFISYIAYHYAHGDTHYGGTGALRIVYLSVLATHVLLSMAIVPMALSALWLAYRKRFATHKKVTRVLTPIWLYVSVTGVVIFFMLRASY